MSVSSGLISCPQIQDDINNKFLAGDPTRARKPQGLGRWVTSAENTRGVLQKQISPGGSKRRKVQLIYTQQVCADDITDDSVRRCTTDETEGNLSEEYEIDPEDGVSIIKRINLSDLQEMCKDNSVYLAERVQAWLDGLEDALNKRIAYDIVLKYGTFGKETPGVDAAKKVVTINTKTGGVYSLDGIEEITQAARFTGYPTIPYLFGFSEIDRYFRRTNAGCCAHDGINIGEYAGQNPAMFVADQYVWDAFKAVGNPEGFLMTTPGAIQLLTFNEFKGDFARRNDDSYKQDVIVNPYTGREWDILMKIDCGDLIVQLKTAAKVVTLPVDMYPSCSEYEGVNYVNAFKIVNT